METEMIRNCHHAKPTLGLLAVLAGVLLASCQTSADEVLSLGEAAASEEASGAATSRKAFRDPYVSAVSGQQQAAPAAAVSHVETDAPSLKRKPVPMAAAYADIAEPPPEVLALQQQALQGQPQAQNRAPAPVDLGELTMQPTAVAPGSNSLFSAGQQRQTSAAAVDESPATQVASSAPDASGSLVPQNMPTLGVNAVRKSLFSPSAEQQLLLQQQAMQQPAAPMPLTEDAASAAVEETPGLKKLSDPRPKRKMLALREPTATVPDQVQLTPDQLQAMGAVEEADPAEPLPAEELVAEADAGARKKGWLPSLSDLLKGGKKKSETVTTP
jgi:hypothetical protein